MPSLRPGFAVYNTFAPEQTPFVLPIMLSLTANTAKEFDVFLEEATGQLGFVQSVFVDNSLNTAELRFIVGGAQQVLVIPAYAQGTFPMYAPNQTRLRAICANSIDIPIQLCNFPQPYLIWNDTQALLASILAALGGGAGSTTYVDFSSTVTLGGTSQVAIAANAARKRLLIVNPSTNTNLESIFVNFGAAAQLGVNSREVVPGSSFELSGSNVTTQSINIISATTGTNFVAKEM